VRGIEYRVLASYSEYQKRYQVEDEVFEEVADRAFEFTRLDHQLTLNLKLVLEYEVVGHGLQFHPSGSAATLYGTLSEFLA